MIVGVYATSKTSYRGGFAQAKPPLAVARNHGIRSEIEAREHETRRTEETRSKIVSKRQCFTYSIFIKFYLKTKP